jgi:4-hydroxybenzoate polyprenyltransferase
MSMRPAATFSGLLYTAALYLAYAAHPRLLPIFALAALLTVLYSAPPVRLRRHALSASLTLGIARGCLLMVGGWAAVQPVWHPAPWFAGLVFGLYIFGAGNTKDFADVRGDRAYGIRTLPVLFGARRAALMIAPFLAGPFLLIPVGVLRGWVPGAGLWLTPLAIWGG